MHFKETFCKQNLSRWDALNIVIIVHVETAGLKFQVTSKSWLLEGGYFGWVLDPFGNTQVLLDLGDEIHHFLVR